MAALASSAFWPRGGSAAQLSASVCAHLPPPRFHLPPSLTMHPPGIHLTLCLVCLKERGAGDPGRPAFPAPALCKERGLEWGGCLQHTGAAAATREDAWLSIMVLNSKLAEILQANCYRWIWFGGNYRPILWAESTGGKCIPPRQRLLLRNGHRASSGSPRPRLQSQRLPQGRQVFVSLPQGHILAALVLEGWVGVSPLPLSGS